jgi:hypothetical protein
LLQAIGDGFLIAKIDALLDGLIELMSANLVSGSFAWRKWFANVFSSFHSSGSPPLALEKLPLASNRRTTRLRRLFGFTEITCRGLPFISA